MQCFQKKKAWSSVESSHGYLKTKAYKAHAWLTTKPHSWLHTAILYQEEESTATLAALWGCMYTHNETVDKVLCPTCLLQLISTLTVANRHWTWECNFPAGELAPPTAHFNWASLIFHIRIVLHACILYFFVFCITFCMFLGCGRKLTNMCTVENPTFTHPWSQVQTGDLRPYYVRAH